MSEKKQKHKETEKLEKERDEYLEGWKRAKADFQNYKREEEERIVRALGLRQESLLEDLIRVLDSFKLGLASWKTEGPEKTGMMLIKTQLEDVLKRNGVETIEVKTGTEFDPSSSECVEMVEKEGEKSGTVVEEIEPGYTMNGKVIRPARVKVAK